MHITSTAFQNHEDIPAEYTCDGRNVNPPLTFSEVPVEAKSLALVVEDPDAPNGTFTHWLLYDILPATLQILENQVPEGAHQATNDFGDQAYGGPCPPSGKHRYFFKLFALDTVLGLEPTARSHDIHEAMEGHVIDQTEIIGLYEKQPVAEELRRQDPADYTDDRNTSDGQTIGPKLP